MDENSGILDPEIGTLASLEGVNEELEVLENWVELTTTDVWKRDKIAEKYNLTEAQERWVKMYLASGNASRAAQLAYPNNNNPKPLGSQLKNNTRIQLYIQETAMECAEIQFEEIIKNKKAPMAVRNAAIIDRLDRAWIWVKNDDDDTKNFFVWNISIQIDK